MKKQITALLALLMTASCFAACGETVDTGVPTDGTNDTAATETTVPAEIPLDQINRENAVLTMEEVDFGGETINILHPGERVYAQDVVGDPQVISLILRYMSEILPLKIGLMSS